MNRELTPPLVLQSDVSINSLVDNSEDVSAEDSIQVVAIEAQSDNTNYVDIPENDYSIIPFSSDSIETPTSRNSQVQTAVAPEISRLEKNDPLRENPVLGANSTDEIIKTSRKCKSAVLTDPIYIENIKKNKKKRTTTKEPAKSTKKRKAASDITNQNLTAVSLQVCTPPYPGYNSQPMNFPVVSPVPALNHQIYSLPNYHNFMLNNSLNKENQQHYLTPPPINVHSGSLQNFSTCANVPQHFASNINNKLINVTTEKSQSVSKPPATNFPPANSNQQISIPSQLQMNLDFANPVVSNLLPANITQPMHTLTPTQSQITHRYSQIASNSASNFLATYGNDTMTPELMISSYTQSVSNSADPCKNFVQGNKINSVSAVGQKKTPTKYKLSNFFKPV